MEKRERKREGGGERGGYIENNQARRKMKRLEIERSMKMKLDKRRRNGERRMRTR